MARPLDPAVTVCVVVFPLGGMSVNVTLAPDAGVPPLVTAAVIDAVLGREKMELDRLRLTASDGGVMTVAFAVPVLAAELVEAFRFTAYVPGGVPFGAPLPMVREADCPGLRVTEGEDREVDHPEGSFDPRLIVLDAHPEESLLVTEAE